MSYAQHSVAIPLSTHRRRAFTLVELLVVIGIIAVLIGILLPALSKARKQGAWATCLSNMRQLGQAILMYSNEYKGYFPRPASGTNGAYPDDFVNWLQPPATSATGQFYAFGDSCLNPMFGNLGTAKLNAIYRCPLDTPEDRPPQAGRTTFGTYKYSYSMNAYWEVAPDLNPVPGFSMDMPRPRFNQVLHGATKILCVEEANPNDGRWIYAPGTDDVTDRHGGKGNILFHDCHVEALYNKQVINNVLSWDDPFHDN